jgi:hypothetical protein
MSEEQQQKELFQLEKEDNRLLRGTKDFRVGAGTSIFKVAKDGIWVGGETYAGAPFKLSYAGVLEASGATISGTINASGGTFSGNVVIGGILKTSAATNVERLIIDATETNKRMIQIWNSSNGVRGWIGKGEESDTDLAISCVASLDFSFAAGLGYERYIFINSTGIHVDPDHASVLALGDATDPFSYVHSEYVRAMTNYLSADNTAGVTENTDVRNAGDTGTTRLKFKNGLFVGSEAI